MKPTNINIFVLAALATFMLVVFAGYSGMAARSIDSDCINHGDVTLDGTITAADAQLAFFIVLGLYSPTYEEECAADCNGDGEVTAVDTQAIFLVILGLSDCVDPLVTPTPTNTPFSNPGALYSTDPIIGNMRCVPHGSFTQGSPVSESCRDSGETQFTHILTKNITVMETEISRQMWADLKAAKPMLPDDPSSTSISPSMNHPVQNNTWYESVLFANLLSVQNGYTLCYYKDATYTIPVDETNYTTGEFFWNPEADGYRLPSEGEWEYFCRAGTTGPFSCDEPDYNSGNCSSCTIGTHEVLEQYCVYCANDTDSTQAVGSKLPNLWNLKNVHGNVYEWCWDWKANYPGGWPTVTDYTGHGTGPLRVLRGGSWSRVAQYCRSANRSGNSPGYRGNFIGFRLLRTTD